MNGQEIITAFELQVSDLTELSSAEELALLNKVYKKLCRLKPWEWLKTAATGTLSTTVPYVSLPADFLFMVQNNNYTESSEYAGRPVVFVGANFQPYKVISWSDRRQYRTSAGYCYVDIAARRLYFTVQPTSADSYEFDYCALPANLTLATSPVFDADFAPILAHLMANEDFVLQLSDKAKSYADENAAKAASYLADMNYANAQLIQQ